MKPIIDPPTSPAAFIYYWSGYISAMERHGYKTSDLWFGVLELNRLAIWRDEYGPDKE